MQLSSNAVFSINVAKKRGFHVNEIRRQWTATLTRIEKLMRAKIYFAVYLFYVEIYIIFGVAKHKLILFPWMFVHFGAVQRQMQLEI